ncbi:hypothetical protein GCM10027515_06670 [Schumannella luteola]
MRSDTDRAEAALLRSQREAERGRERDHAHEHGDDDHGRHAGDGIRVARIPEQPPSPGVMPPVTGRNANPQPKNLARVVTRQPARE